MTRESTPNAAWMFELDAVQSWAYMDNLFTREECERLVEIGNQRTPTPAITGIKDVERNKQLRDSQVAWLYPADDLHWAFLRVASAVDSLNNQFFKFDVYGMVEGFQFTKYEAPSGYYGLHVDRVLNSPPRKLSVTIQLNDNDDFDGGELCLYEGREPVQPPMHQGKMVLFPSYTLHEVRPVTRGTRYSLVCWITGRQFK